MQNVKHLKPIEQAYQDVLSEILTSQITECGTSLSLPKLFLKFASNLKEYVEYSGTIEPLILTTLQQESNKMSCSSTQQKANNRVQTSITSFNSNLSQVTNQVSSLLINLQSDYGNLLIHLNRESFIISAKLYDNAYNFIGMHFDCKSKSRL